MTAPDDRPAGVNWAGNLAYRAARLHRPASLEQVQEIVAAAPRVRVLGSRHSFNEIADSAELISLEAVHAESAFPAAIDVDLAAGTVSLSGGVKYGELAEVLRDEGAALHNLASLPHISVAGAVATATHGSGVGNGNLATAVSALELVRSDGEVLRVRRGDPDFDGMVVNLGALGVVTRLSLDVEPAYEVSQRVFEHLPWTALDEHFDEIVSAGYSVSLFTLWGEDVEMVWVKSRTDRPSSLGDDLFGAAAATTELNPVIGLDPTPCTPQLGRPGLWSDRMPHFRMGFTPSAGEELQAEYLVPARSAVEALRAVRSLGDRIRPLLLTCEIRTVAADELWMSTAHGEPTVAVHFTWRPAQDEVLAVLAELERALEPFAPRPHWGKLFCAGGAELAGRYERHADFVGLVERLDPRGAFRNDWFEATVLDG
ncbi:D-arabinono-1,4-lactone oxidase [Blastococcus sp. TF02A-30]|uniref:D-arabinono-1,4-lactone oxidase n=1 Tax=Blastococcus sp. TF02A-30 TaxID=2250580 RepID=UPI000DEB4E01|nr:D-arabinono-1,4-lactone oxidase [Blastococcus sp. TF02A-30]RBY87809.1 FAD-binding protein [Blastococcus sp. TF02A-30]